MEFIDDVPLLSLLKNLEPESNSPDTPTSRKKKAHKGSKMSSLKRHKSTLSVASRKASRAQPPGDGVSVNDNGYLVCVGSSFPDTVFSENISLKVEQETKLLFGGGSLEDIMHYAILHCGQEHLGKRTK